MAKVAKEKKIGNGKKSKEYFQVSDDIIFDVFERLQKKAGLEVSLITCFELKVVWLESKYTREGILKLLQK